MSREWLAVYTAMVTKPKYRRLSPIGRGALLHVLILAGFQTPEATWNPDELREALILDGFPDGALNELLGLGWLEHEDGALVIHDWDQHQWAATLAARRTWEAARKREWRHRKASPSPAPLTPTEKNITTQHKGPGHVPDMSQTPNGGDGPSEGMEEVVSLYRNLYHRPPSEGAWSWLASQVDAFGSERVWRALGAEHARNPSPKDLISRMEKGLRTGDQIRKLEAVQ
jgi:hypothetical protein